MWSREDRLDRGERTNDRQQTREKVSHISLPTLAELVIGNVDSVTGGRTPSDKLGYARRS